MIFFFYLLVFSNFQIVEFKRKYVFKLGCKCLNLERVIFDPKVFKLKLSSRDDNGLCFVGLRRKSSYKWLVPGQSVHGLDQKTSTLTLPIYRNVDMSINHGTCLINTSCWVMLELTRLNLNKQLKSLKNNVTYTSWPF